MNKLLRGTVVRKRAEQCYPALRQSSHRQNVAGSPQEAGHRFCAPKTREGPRYRSTGSRTAFPHSVHDPS